jgi:hypothetical protein
MYFEKAIKLNPNFIPAYIDIMLCYQNKNDEQSLKKYIRIALNMGISISYIEAHHIKVPADMQ